MSKEIERLEELTKKYEKIWDKIIEILGKEVESLQMNHSKK